MKTRNTIQRSLVLDSLMKLHNHPTAEEICEDVRRVHPDISLATVYRNLNTLERMGDVFKIPIANSADRFDINLDGHSHVICEVCERVTDVMLPTDNEARATVQQATGYIKVRENVLYIGVCPSCTKTPVQ